MRRESDNGAQPKRRLISIISGVLVIAAPGSYSAIKEIQSNHEQNLKIESVTRDKLDTDMQANVVANTVGLESLEKQCVTHKELLELTMKLQDQFGKRHRTLPPMIDIPDSVDLKGDITDELKELTEAIKEEEKSSKRYIKVKLARPKMKSAKSIRNIVQKKASDGASLDSLEF